MLVSISEELLAVGAERVAAADRPRGRAGRPGRLARRLRAAAPAADRRPGPRLGVAARPRRASGCAPCSGSTSTSGPASSGRCTTGLDLPTAPGDGARGVRADQLHPAQRPAARPRDARAARADGRCARSATRLSRVALGYRHARLLRTRVEQRAPVTARSVADPSRPPHRGIRDTRGSRYVAMPPAADSPGSLIVRAAARRQRWAGPPPLLILATVAGFLRVLGAQRRRRPRARQPARAERAADEAARRVTPVAHRRRAADPRPRRAGRSSDGTLIGVVAFNQYRKLSVAQARRGRAARSRGRDAGRRHRVAGGVRQRPGLRPALRKPGWDTRRFPRTGRRSWPSRGAGRTFELVSSASRLVASGMDPDDRPLPVPEPVRRPGDPAAPRHRPTAERHLHRPAAEDRGLRPPGPVDDDRATRSRRSTSCDRMTWEWEHAPGRWVVGTGDYNVDARVDARLGAAARPAGRAR